MKSVTKSLSRLLTVGLVAATTAVCSAQTTNTIVAEYGTAPGAGSDFTIKLVNTGETKAISGFAFKLQYDPAQVAITGVTNNTGQPSASVQYTLGPEVKDANGAHRVLAATTVSDLQNAGNLVEIKLQKKAGFTPPLTFSVTDRTSEPIVDGLQGASLENIPHEFNTSAVNQ